MKIAPFQPQDISVFMRLCTTMHHESRFRDWALNPHELIHAFLRCIESDYHRGYLLQTDAGEAVGTICLKICKRTAVEVWEVIDDVFYIDKAHRGKEGFSLLVDTAKQLTEEVQSVLNMPVVLYLCPSAAIYSRQIARALEKMGGVTVGYSVMMET